ncbi:hypothetical protein ACFQL8_19380 [Streptomyces goshikiensis]|uniref:hypothetical protein n=1 Tax=Streptomyces goshikiensis TaxID=1942 RepID=UPI0016755E71|nr:hypothetical protein [Streptomyces goshikiensis]GHD79426.1 hypothetical protein GCM10010336_61450 [Streptomyces goshikiensis]
MIHAHATGTATTDDLHRWVRRDSEAFLRRHPVPGPAPHQLGLRPFETALDHAATPVEASAVVLAALDAAEQVVHDLSTFLLHAGYRYPRPAQNTAGSRKQLWSASSGLLAALAAADDGIKTALRAEYDLPPARKRTVSGRTLPPSSPPVTPPAPRP